MVNGRKILRIVLWSLGGFALVVTGILLSTYFILRTPSMQEKILQSIREPLAKAGLDPQIQSLSIDLFGGVSLDGLDLKINRPPLATGQVKLAHLRLRYAFWPLLSRRLSISELSIDGVSGQLKLNLPPAEEKPPAEPLDLNALLDKIRNPPVTLDSPELSLRMIDLQLDVTQGPLSAQARIQSAELKLAVALSPGLLDVKIDGSLPLQTRVAIENQLKLDTRIDLALNPQIRLDVEESKASWTVKWPRLALKLDALELEQRSPSGLLQVSLPSFSYLQSIELQHEAPLPSNPQIADLLWPLRIELKQKLETSPLQLVKDTKGRPAERLKLALKAGLENSMKATLPSAEALEQAAWSLAMNLNLNGIKVQRGGQQLLETPSLLLTLEGEGEEGKGSIASQLDGEKLNSQFLSSPLELKQKLAAQLNLGRRELHLQLAETLNGFDILDLRLDAEDPEDKELVSKLTIDLKTDPRLLRLHPGAKILPQLAYPNLHLVQDLTLQHPMPLLKIQGSDLNKLTITNFLTMKLRQTKTSAETLARFKNLEIKEEAQWLAEKLKLRLDIKADGLAHAALKRPIDLNQTVEIEGRGGERIQGTLKAATQLGSAELLTLRADLQDLLKKAVVSSELNLQARPELQAELDALKILSDTGPISIKSAQTITLEHGAPSLQKMGAFDLKKVSIDAELEQTIKSLASKSQAKYRLLQPLRILSRAKLVRGKGSLNTRVSAPELEAQDLAHVKDARVGVIASLSDLDKMALIEAKVVAQVAAVDLKGELGAKPELQGLLRQIQVILHASLKNKEKLHISNLFASLQHPFLQFRGQGDLALAGRGDFNGKLDVVMSEEAKAGLKGKGRFQLPLQITIYDKQKISLRAEPKFQAFSLNFGAISLQNAQGSLLIQEELSLDKKGKIGFLYLNTQNPFVRVDYESVEPYVGNPNLLSIDKLRFKHIELGPIVQNFEVRQNLVYLNDFKADLLGGSTLGRLYFDLHPERLQLGFLGRFSNLQPELLKEPARRNKTDKAVLSGRMGSSFDIRQRLASGRIDITSIGRQQLSSLLDVLDPDYKDNQIGTARRAIQLAYPKFVSISMNQGLMDLTIGMGGAISKDIFIRSIPLSALISAQLGTTLQRIETLIQEGDNS